MPVFAATQWQTLSPPFPVKVRCRQNREKAASFQVYFTSRRFHADKNDTIFAQMSLRHVISPLKWRAPRRRRHAIPRYARLCAVVDRWVGRQTPRAAPD